MVAPEKVATPPVQTGLELSELKINITEKEVEDVFNQIFNAMDGNDAIRAHFERAAATMVDTIARAADERFEAFGLPVFTDHTFAASNPIEIVRNPTNINRLMLVFDNNKGLAFDFSRCLSEDQLEFDRTIGVSTLFYDQMAPACRVHGLEDEVICWNNRSAIADCQAFPMPTGVKTITTFTNETPEIEALYRAGIGFADKTTAIKAANLHCERMIAYQTRSVADAVSKAIPLFKVFLKNRTYVIVSSGVRCPFRMSYYGVRCIPTKDKVWPSFAL